MSELAAAAYEAEQEHVDTGLEVRDVMGVRDLMLRLAKLEQTAEELKHLRDAVMDRYQQRLAGIAEEQEALRSSIEAFILHVNGGKKVVVPDAGTAYLSTRNKGGKLTIADDAALRAWMDDHLPDGAPLKTALNRQEAVEALRDLLYTTPDGTIVDRTTGEVFDVPGLTAEPETKTLGLRKA